MAVASHAPCETVVLISLALSSALHASPTEDRAVVVPSDPASGTTGPSQFGRERDRDEGGIGPEHVLLAVNQALHHAHEHHAGERFLVRSPLNTDCQDCVVQTGIVFRLLFSLTVNSDTILKRLH